MGYLGTLNAACDQEAWPCNPAGIISRRENYMQ